MLPHTKQLEEPWRSFLDELDSYLKETVELHCCGGFAATKLYGVPRETSDVDYIGIVPVHSEIATLAGEDSALCEKYKVFVHPVNIATYPESYEDRLIEMHPGTWKNLKIYALEVHDLALTKLERNIDRDRDDIEYLAKTRQLDPAVLKQRYLHEFRPNLIALAHIQTCDEHLQLWLDSYWPATK